MRYRSTALAALSLVSTSVAGASLASASVPGASPTSYVHTVTSSTYSGCSAAQQSMIATVKSKATFRIAAPCYPTTAGWSSVIGYDKTSGPLYVGDVKATSAGAGWATARVATHSAGGFATAAAAQSHLNWAENQLQSMYGATYWVSVVPHQAVVTYDTQYHAYGYSVTYMVPNGKAKISSADPMKTAAVNVMDDDVFWK